MHQEAEAEENEGGAQERQARAALEAVGDEVAGYDVGQEKAYLPGAVEEAGDERQAGQDEDDLAIGAVPDRVVGHYGDYGEEEEFSRGDFDGKHGGGGLCELALLLGGDEVGELPYGA